MSFCRLLGSTVLFLVLGCGLAAGVSAQEAPTADTYTLKLPAGDPSAASEQNGNVQFIGTATVLIRYRGLTKAAAQITLAAIAFNLRRWAAITG